MPLCCTICISKIIRIGSTNSIKDETLAEEVHQIEITMDISPSESRDRIKLAIEKRYTQPT